MLCVNNADGDGTCAHKLPHDLKSGCPLVTLSCPYPCMEVEIEDEKDVQV